MRDLPQQPAPEIAPPPDHGDPFVLARDLRGFLQASARVSRANMLENTG